MTSRCPAWTWCLTESSRMLLCRRHAVWIDCQLSNPEPLPFFNKYNTGYLCSYLRLLRPATTSTSPSWVTCLIYMYMNEGVGRQLNRYIILKYQVTVVNIGWSNGLLPADTESLPELMLTYHQKGSVKFTLVIWQEVLRSIKRVQIVVHFSNHCHISQWSMS